MPSSKTTTIYVCKTCRPEGFTAEDDERPGAKLAKSLRAKQVEQTDGANIVVKAVECLAVCKRPTTVAFMGEDKFTFLIGDLEPERDEADIFAFANSYSNSEDGIVPWRERPEVIRKGTVARIPAIGSQSKLVSDINPDD